MEDKETLKRAKAYIDGLTIHSEKNIPESVIADDHLFFTWDHERRTPFDKLYLFNWSYYHGVVMEGLYDIDQSAPDQGGQYYNYVKNYLDAMIVHDKDGNAFLDQRRAGYVDYHGADCYKTAELLMKMSRENDDYRKIASALYRDLTDPAHRNSHGNVISQDFMEKELGWNYWHSWAGKQAPRYKVWLDGMYMMQPFLAHYASVTGDEKQLALIGERFLWVSDNLIAPNGLYYHAGNGKNDVCPYHWTRAMGWYGMAMVDVMESAGKEKELEETIRPILKKFADGVLRFQTDSGMWANLADRPVTKTNRLETSGTAMIVYTILKGVRNGWLDESYRSAAVKGFTALTEQKLDQNGLHDIYMKAAAKGTNDYEDENNYVSDEGKGSGPYMMAYSEMIR